MKLLSTLILLMCSSWAWGQDKIATPTYWTAVGIAASSAAADASTTLLLIGPQSHTCPLEVWTPELYGEQPKPARTIAVMGSEVIGAAVLSYEWRKHVHGRVGRMWLTPLAYVAAVHARATIHNASYCQ